MIITLYSLFNGSIWNKSSIPITFKNRSPSPSWSHVDCIIVFIKVGLPWENVVFKSMYKYTGKHQSLLAHRNCNKMNVKKCIGIQVYIIHITTLHFVLAHKTFYNFNYSKKYMCLYFDLFYFQYFMYFSHLPLFSRKKPNERLLSAINLEKKLLSAWDNNQHFPPLFNWYQ